MGIKDQLPSLQVDDRLPQLENQSLPPENRRNTSRTASSVHRRVASGTQENRQHNALRATSSVYKRTPSETQHTEPNQAKRLRRDPVVPSPKPLSIASDTTVRGGVRLSLPSTPTGGTSSVATDSTLSIADDPGPELAPLKDLSNFRNDFPDRNNSMGQFERIRTLSFQRGRVVAITLHEPVHYSTSALVERIFGGTIQEIQ